MNYTLMNIEMTKAILDGRKVQTRRVVKDKVSFKIIDEIIHRQLKDRIHRISMKDYLESFPTYKVDETIWVKEPARIINTFVKNGIDMMDYSYSDSIVKRLPIPKKHLFKKWMENNKGVPNGCIKEMARIFLKITNVRVEMLQDISVQDIEKEGIITLPPIDGYHSRFFNGKNYFNEPFPAWINLWNKTAPKGYKWENNPTVFVYEFERITLKDSQIGHLDE